MEKAVSHKCVTCSAVIKVLPGHAPSQSSFLFALFFCGSTDPPSIQRAEYFGSDANLCDKKIIWQWKGHTTSSYCVIILDLKDFQQVN